jgi:hypothetical protein
VISDVEIRAVLLASEKFLRWRPIAHKRKFSHDAAGDTLPAMERHYTPLELSESWGLSTEVVRALFRDEPDVLKIRRPATRTKRGYLTLRIPESVAQRVHRRMAE